MVRVSNKIARRSLSATFVLLGAWLLAGTALGGGNASAADDNFSISGRQILHNGRPFEVHGLGSVALIEPIAEMRAEGLSAYTPAYEHLKENLGVARGFGANTIRFNLDVLALDPQNARYSAAYLNDVANAINTVRAEGFVVIPVLQPPPGLPQGDPNNVGLPNETYARADLNLMDRFKTDRGVMLELFNEPYGPQTQATWRSYISEINHLILELRSHGEKNILLVEPINQKFQTEAPGSQYPGGVTDPLNQILWAIHPYYDPATYFDGADPSKWGLYFGDFAATHPVIVSEWHANVGPLGDLSYDWCKTHPIDTVRQSFKYFSSKLDGVVGWGYDGRGWVVLLGYQKRPDGSEYLSSTPTSYNYKDIGCGTKQSPQVGRNFGELLKDYFAGHVPDQPIHQASYQ
jgi:endoglucanase